MKNFITAYFTAVAKRIKRADSSVSAVSAMTLTLRGMRGTQVYTLANENGKTELRLYRSFFSDGKSVLKLEKSAECALETLIEQMNACGVLRWDGFHGKHPKKVQDGMMFCFQAVVNDGQSCRADGSANFPKGFHEFVQKLNRLLTEQTSETDSDSALS